MHEVLWYSFWRRGAYTVKKLILWILSVAICATASIGGTWAYLVNAEEETNVMTVGKVIIEQLEYERSDPESAQDAVVIRRFHNNKPLYPGVHPNDFDFTQADSQIHWDAIGKEDYTSGIWNPESVNNELDKMVFVRNLGNRDAYIRTVFAFETSPDWSFASFRQMVHLNKNREDWSWAWIETPVTIGDGLYYVAVATYDHVLAPDALTEVSLSQVMLDKKTTGNDISKLGSTYQVLVYSQAVQTDGFEDPVTALNEGFGAINTTQVPFLDDQPDAGVKLKDALRYWEADGTTDITTQVSGVVFGTYEAYPQIPLTNDGTLVAEQGSETSIYYVPDAQGMYTIYVLSEDPVYAPADCTGLFEGMTGLTSVVTENFDMSRVTSMANMFKGCTALTELDATGWNTTNVTDMSGTFYQCGALTRILGLENWDTGAVTNMQHMFYHAGLTGDLDLRNWEVSNVTNMSHMFNECYNVTNINAAGWDTASVTTMRSMFRECLKAQTINVTGWNTVNVTDTYTMFIRCRAMTDLIGSGGLDFRNVILMCSMCEGWDSMVYVDVTNWNCGSCTDMSQMFAWGLSLETIEGIRNWDVSNVTTMSAMFYDSGSLKELDLSGWNTSSVRQMSNMFRYCDALQEVNLAGWDTSSVVDSRLMFFDAKSLERIYVSDSWDMSNVTSGSKTFGNNTKLTGGNGTQYSDRKIGVDYARIDLPAQVDDQGNVIREAVPGYLTHIRDKSEFTEVAFLVEME